MFCAKMRLLVEF